MAQPIQHTLALDETDDLQLRACELAAYWIGRAREITGASARRLPVPEVRFDLRGRAAGQAVFARRTRRCHIRLNAELLASHSREMLDQTVPHEVAHVAVYRLHGRRARPHGAEWKALMHAFGVDASPCHTLPAEPTRQLKRFRYACDCHEPAWLTSIRHKRALAGTDYVCRVCGAKLEYAEV
ncbi:SprT-like domain-containing protein [Salinisphaera sp.]|uniref:SprT family zinc-dependent metalloprotease n=1 Tax=Salinisphaera sp. TaxID=1914330 RepID=UPI002D77439F|nr:SprT-like domain-containing protein [Salinisphaera sp.]HET7314302.1 SprT-like domain-containing protein [Salinisphaera sp.]